MNKINEVKIGKYGRIQFAFIKEHRKDLYTERLFSDGLEQYCESNETVQERILMYTQQIAGHRRGPESAKPNAVGGHDPADSP